MVESNLKDAEESWKEKQEVLCSLLIYSSSPRRAKASARQPQGNQRATGVAASMRPFNFSDFSNIANQHRTLRLIRAISMTYLSFSNLRAWPSSNAEKQCSIRNALSSNHARTRRTATARKETQTELLRIGPTQNAYQRETAQWRF